MNKFKLALSVSTIVSAVGCHSPDIKTDPQIVIKNPADGGAISQLVSLTFSTDKQKELSQFNTAGLDSEWRILANGEKALDILVSLAPGEEKTVSFSTDGKLVEDVAYAELSVRTGGEWQGKAYQADGFSFENVKQFESPEQLTDHSYYLRYEGPGWENDLIGYRLYLDWRNGIDVFAKTGAKPGLAGVGQDGYDSYHELADWGADVLKVGSSLGLGALGRIKGEEVIHFQEVDNTSWTLLGDNKLSASFNVNYQGWSVANKKVDVSTDYTIHAGDPTTLVKVTLSEPIDNLVTGLVNHPNTHFIKQQYKNWEVIATYGAQSIAAEGDELGLAIFYQTNEVSEQYRGQHDYLVKFNPTTNLTYGLMAVWPQHPSSPKNRQEFEALLNDKLHVLAFPVEATVTY
ncbi:DUF4861 family protein [Paraglaciecola arctica]|uniref:Unsaturated rhamnogalacturonyl hydrolase, putative, urh105A n=1 Tax=Paraglaciecola arctica BSs20135 TaxID=493475 RepID=K6ZF73_9ALTE|nr:DUF4861 family protein [Paraglaciecola arctica]GAC22060.1 unsaturated rhamnogalacturonyl hydrolase, putative, urh105A [Paraglaciecola arctica BSs20135]